MRDQLDYLAWVGEACEALGFHGGPELEAWRGRVQRAYAAMVDAMAAGHGDPFPPDVPPAVKPGTWPDVASAAVAGVTIRHQLAAIRVIAAQSRMPRPYPRSAADVAAWTQRVQTAYDALDHGDALVMPASARTEAPAPPAPVGTKRRGAGRSSAGKAPVQKPSVTKVNSKPAGSSKPQPATKPNGEKHVPKRGTLGGTGKASGRGTRAAAAGASGRRSARTPAAKPTSSSARPSANKARKAPAGRPRPGKPKGR